MPHMVKIGYYQSRFLAEQTIEEKSQCFLLTLKEGGQLSTAHIIGDQVIGSESDRVALREYLCSMYARRTIAFLDGMKGDDEWLVKLSKMEFLSWMHYNQHIGRGANIGAWIPMEIHLSVDPGNYRAMEFVVIVNNKPHRIVIDLKTGAINGARTFRSLIPVYSHNPELSEGDAVKEALRLSKSCDIDKLVIDNARDIWEMGMAENASLN